MIQIAKRFTQKLSGAYRRRPKSKSERLKQLLGECGYDVLTVHKNRQRQKPKSNIFAFRKDNPNEAMHIYERSDFIIVRPWTGSYVVENLKARLATVTKEDFRFLTGGKLLLKGKETKDWLGWVSPSSQRKFFESGYNFNENGAGP